MFRLSNTSLPIAPSDYKLAPLARIWMGNRYGMGALLKTNIFANQQDIDAQILPTPDPIHKGKLIKTAIPAGLDITQITDYIFCPDPINIQPFQYWTNNNFLYFYVIGETPTVLTTQTIFRSRITRPDVFIYEFQTPNDLTINEIKTNQITFMNSPDFLLSNSEFIQEQNLIAIAASETMQLNRNFQPILEEDWNYSIDLPNNFMVLQIESLGLEFSPTSQNRPNPGEFKQTGTQLTICGSPQFHLDFGQEVICIGNNQLLVNDLTQLQIATFYIPTVFYLEKIEWLGISFSPSQDSFSPNKNEFVWNNSGYITIFY